ncbi:endonuclease, partial [Campylobacter novaezeelandiae]|nr:endonuclease [Campylobacter novaezeelandiae]
MKFYEKIALNFREFLAKEGEKAYKNLKNFFEIQKQNFYNEKIKELKSLGLNEQDSIIKARQGWVSVIGRSLELVIEILIKDFCDKHKLKITNDKILKSKNLNNELDLVKRALIVHFNEFSVLPDGDII